MKKNIEVSVIMSTYNTKEEYLRSAIKSILNQTLKEIEFIIINDGGTNLPIIEQFNDDRIIIINHEETKGLPFSLNEAIEKSKGKYIARMDSDDISKVDRLAKQKKYLDKNTHIDMCAMFYKQFNQETNFIINSFCKYKYIASQLFIKNVLSHPTIMFRKSFLIENKLRYSLEYIYSQDFEFWTRCTQRGKISIIPKLGLYYRMHENQIRSSKKEKQNQLCEKILLRNLSEIDLDETYLKFIKMLRGNYEDQIDFIELANFIDLAIEKNNKIKRYDEKSFRKILYNAYFNLLLKNRKIKELLNFKIINKTINFSNIVSILKKVFFRMQLYIEMIFDKTLKINKG